MILKAGTYTFNVRPEETYPLSQTFDFTVITTIDGEVFSEPHIKIATDIYSNTNFRILITHGIASSAVYLNPVPAQYESGYPNGWVYGTPMSVKLDQDANVEEPFGTWFIASTDYNRVNSKFLLKAGVYTFNELPYLQPIVGDIRSIYSFQAPHSVTIEGTTYEGELLDFSIFETDELAPDEYMPHIAGDIDTLYEGIVNDDWYTNGWLNGYDKKITILEDTNIDASAAKIFIYSTDYNVVNNIPSEVCGYRRFVITDKKEPYYSAFFWPRDSEISPAQDLELCGFSVQNYEGCKELSIVRFVPPYNSYSFNLLGKTQQDSIEELSSGIEHSAFVTLQSTPFKVTNFANSTVEGWLLEHTESAVRLNRLYLGEAVKKIARRQLRKLTNTPVYDPYNLIGTWVFDNQPRLPAELENKEFQISFTCGDTSYNRILPYASDTTGVYRMWYNWDGLYSYSTQKWNKTEHQTIVITAGADLSNKLLADWIKSSAVKKGNYLSFTSPASFTLATANLEKNWNGELEYSTDISTWNIWDGITILSADGGKLYMRGTGNEFITYENVKTRWVLTGSNISCLGNIENLLDYATVAQGEHPTMRQSCYIYMFRNCTSLTTAPELPALTLTLNCYHSMFYGCENLTIAPKLPATTLAECCYVDMFRECTRLITAPELPATTLARACYSGMFNGCKSLTTAPELPVTTLAEDCYHDMFKGCTSLTTIPELPATTLPIYCYHDMFKDCTGIKLSTTQTGEYQTPYRIPTSGTGQTASYALDDMFTNTGGTFTGTPEINTTYYTSNMVV